MCDICRHAWCVRGCPNYEPEYEAVGTCEVCGCELFEDGATLCPDCEEDEA